MVSIKTLRRQQNTFYKSIVSVFCPLINETVYFTSDGYHHLIFKSNRKWRNINEQYLKLKCLTQAPDIIKNCTRILETRKEMFTIKGKQKPVVTYELICDNKKYRSVTVIA